MSELLFIARQCSQSDAGICYSLSVWSDGSVSCSCTGYKFRRNCKHVQSVATLYGGPRHFVLIDAADLESVQNYGWQVRAGNGKTFYAASKKVGLLHRYILDLPKWVNNKISPTVDFISGEGRDCRRCNMRVCSWLVNSQNRRKHIDTSSSFLGVSKSSNKRGFIAQFQSAGLLRNFFSKYSTPCAIWRDHVAASQETNTNLNFEHAGNASRIYSMAYHLRRSDYHTAMTRKYALKEFRWGKWSVSAYVKELNEKIYLGRVETEQEADEICRQVKQEKLYSILNHDYMQEALEALSIRNSVELYQQEVIECQTN